MLVNEIQNAVSIASANATFEDKNVGTAKPVTVNGVSLVGADAGNYSLTQPTGLTANWLTMCVTQANCPKPNASPKLPRPCGSRCSCRLMCWKLIITAWKKSGFRRARRMKMAMWNRLTVTSKRR